MFLTIQKPISPYQHRVFHKEAPLPAGLINKVRRSSGHTLPFKVTKLQKNTLRRCFFLTFLLFRLIFHKDWR